MFGLTNVSITRPAPVQVEQYNTQQLGVMFQNANPNKIIAMSWEKQGSGPTLYVFKDVNEILNMMRGEYNTPFVLADLSDPVSTKENAVLQFNDPALEITVTSYQDAGTVYKFFRPEIYLYLKQQLSQNTIPWMQFGQY